MRLPSYQALSKEQDRINDLPLDGRHLVVGPPGTGKTVMALYRVSMLRRQGRHAELLMYSRLLTQYTSSAIRELLLDGTVGTYHRWFYDFYWSTYHARPPEITRFQYDFAEALNVIARDPPATDTAAELIIDEGQDLPKEFYALSRIIAQNLAVFADENQRITEGNSTLRDIRTFGGLGDPLHLTRNYRNTLEIARLAATFYTGLPSGTPDLPERTGELPVMRGFRSVSDAVESVRIFERNNPDLEIGVFTPTKKVQQRFVAQLGEDTMNPVQFYEGGQGAKGRPVSFDEPGITIVNFPSAKGLELDAVFIPEIQDVAADLAGPDVRMRFYVLISRARGRLQISYSGSNRPPIVDLFPDDLVEWR